MKKDHSVNKNELQFTIFKNILPRGHRNPVRSPLDVERDSSS